MLSEDILRVELFCYHQKLKVLVDIKDLEEPEMP